MSDWISNAKPPPPLPCSHGISGFCSSCFHNEQLSDLERLRGIVRDLAAASNSGAIGNENTGCVLCPVTGTDLKTIKEEFGSEDHYAECPWRRAVEECAR